MREQRGTAVVTRERRGMPRQKRGKRGGQVAFYPFLSLGVSSRERLSRRCASSWVLHDRTCSTVYSGVDLLTDFLRAKGSRDCRIDNPGSVVGLQPFLKIFDEPTAVSEAAPTPSVYYSPRCT